MAVAYGAGLFSPDLDAGDFSRRFHGHDERIDVESLRLTTQLWLDVVTDLLMAESKPAAPTAPEGGTHRDSGGLPSR